MHGTVLSLALEGILTQERSMKNADGRVCNIWVLKIGMVSLSSPDQRITCQGGLRVARPSKQIESPIQEELGKGEGGFLAGADAIGSSLDVIAWGSLQDSALHQASRPKLDSRP
ncbi:hypothetical protein BDK51DRAFT_31864 [Blyttiomyces helicus]|uniref:Uncharacterized protein n=1 Tax=Blyttiomyces helicus TaxID=388810 RepID=A0A4P9WFX2_9FUNG|nr:hypothetical protein BDK51DRAFT_31864 [Blyttiomyces helicus]|eukprot:RKO90785.1 hypothetical protein BDK51DRAFT_31864 [Blyttiomyces helicus]